MHSYSRIDFALDGQYAAFRTQYAIANDTKTQYADVIVRIKVDGKTVHEQEHVRADALSPLVIVDIPKAARQLTLEVDYGDANDTQDHFNWIEPALLRQKPAPPAPPPMPMTQPAAPTTQPAPSTGATASTTKPARYRTEDLPDPRVCFAEISDLDPGSNGFRSEISHSRLDRMSLCPV